MSTRRSCVVGALTRAAHEWLACRPRATVKLHVNGTVAAFSLCDKSALAAKKEFKQDVYVLVISPLPGNSPKPKGAGL